MKPCTLEQLAKRIADGSAPALVWTPETLYLVPTVEVPSLLESVRKGARADARKAIQTSGFNAFAWLFISIVSGQRWLLLLAAMLGVLPLLQALYASRQARLLNPERAIQMVPVARLGAWLAQRRAWITNTIVVGLVLIGVLQLLLGLAATIVAAGLVKSLVHTGQYWRLMTATMLHGGLFHLLFNAGALAALGRQLELLTNRRLLIIVYTLSAVGGSLFSLVLLPHATSVGASGAIMGLLGALICLAIRSRRILPADYLRSLLANVGMIAVIGAIGFTMIDNAAHLGGLLVGFVCVLILVRRPSSIPIPPTRLDRYLAAACATLLAFAFLLTGFFIVTCNVP